MQQRALLRVGSRILRKWFDNLTASTYAVRTYAVGVNAEVFLLYKGRVHKFGDNVNTDEIIPARYLNTTDRLELAKHCMEGIDKGFFKKVRPGDVIIAGKNFGCGSSREHAPIAIKASGVSCVIAESFARIFFRNSINIGLPIIESKEARERIRPRDLVRVNTKLGIIRNLTRRVSYRFEKYPPFMQRIIRSGGLMDYIKTHRPFDKLRVVPSKVEGRQAQGLYPEHRRRIKKRLK